MQSKLNIFLIILLFFIQFNFSIYAQNNRDELEKKLEDIQKERWQYKADIINLRKKIRDEIENIEHEQNLLMQRINLYDEEYFCLKEEGKKLKDEYELKKENMNCIMNIFKEKIDSYKANINNTFPWKIVTRLTLLKKIEGKIDSVSAKKAA